MTLWEIVWIDWKHGISFLSYAELVFLCKLLLVVWFPKDKLIFPKKIDYIRQCISSYDGVIQSISKHQPPPWNVSYFKSHTLALGPNSPHQNKQYLIIQLRLSDFSLTFIKFHIRPGKKYPNTNNKFHDWLYNNAWRTVSE